MRNNIVREDLDAVIEYLRTDDPILTNGANVRAFEEEWSRWLGVDYSVFVNSGASANLLTIAALKLRFPEGGEVIVPPLTWSSDISSLIHYGFSPVFVDIDRRTLGMDARQVIAKLNDNTRAVFLTHVQGFDALEDELLDVLHQRNVLLIEDVCESHGARHNGRKLGTFGWASNFSFYYAHHMTTIEGGMISTDDPELYQQLRILRSHGMVREATDEQLQRRYVEQYPDLNPEFIFAFPAYNVRNTEIGAIMGRQQLGRLNDNIEKRNRNLRVFLGEIDSTRFQTDFKLEGCSNYAFNLILREPDEDLVTRVMARMRQHGIEYRRGSAGGGNQMRQPYVRDLVGNLDFSQFSEVEHVHRYGFYIGNFPDLSEAEVREIASVLNAS